ncbi:MAG: hypothetical protein JWL74_1778 [Alphaproteobacteria bacterium]|nr:hypothetical protein [Alphaproteobacteria bacterium]
MAIVSPRRYILVVAPSATASIGDVLRRAFQRPEYSRPVMMFERLIERLDRLG